MKQHTYAADVAVGKQVHMLMWDRHLKGRDAARALGLHESTFNLKLRGKRKWTLDELLAIAEWLDVPVTDLLPTNEKTPHREALAASGEGPVEYTARDLNPEPADYVRSQIRAIQTSQTMSRATNVVSLDNYRRARNSRRSNPANLPAAWRSSWRNDLPPAHSK